MVINKDAHECRGITDEEKSHLRTKLLSLIDQEDTQVLVKSPPRSLVLIACRFVTRFIMTFTLEAYRLARVCAACCAIGGGFCQDCTQ